MKIHLIIGFELALGDHDVTRQQANDVEPFWHSWKLKADFSWLGKNIFSKISKKRQNEKTSVDIYRHNKKEKKKNLLENKLDEENDIFYERYSSLQIALFVDSWISQIFSKKKKRNMKRKKSQRCSEKCEEIMTA